jgi:branched-chain amino acid transport system permease protein
MDATIAGILALDGLSNGAVYALLALATVLVFAVTRVIFIPQGEFVAFAALTLALLQAGRVPGTVWFLLVLAAAVTLQDLVHGLRHGAGAGRLAKQALRTLAWPVAVSLIAIWAAPKGLPLLAQAALTVALVTPFGALLYRLAYESLADASVLVLLIVSVGVHFALVGLGLFFFGAEGFRNPSFWDARFALGPLALSGQTVIVFAASLALIVGLWLFFEKSLAGKALRATAVNRLGARLMGISTSSAGRLSFTMAAFIGALSGLLIGPTTTVFYDSGFLIGLKGFVAAVFAGLASYPLALVGALGVGLLEAYGSFWSSPYKEVIVFSAILPVLLWRSLRDPHGEDH